MTQDTVDNLESTIRRLEEEIQDLEKELRSMAREIGQAYSDGYDDGRSSSFDENEGY